MENTRRTFLKSVAVAGISAASGDLLAVFLEIRKEGGGAIDKECRKAGMRKSGL